jgi:hypothetical protein
LRSHHAAVVLQVATARRRATVLPLVPLVVLTALSLVSCRSAPAPQPLTVVLVDLTTSTRAANTSMRQDFRVVVDQVAAEHGRLLVDAIDGNPLAHARVLIDQSFRVPEAQGNRLVERSKLAARKAAANSAMDALLEGPRPARSTDVFGALVSGAHRLGSIPDAGRRRLVFLSDMVSTTTPHNMRGQQWDQPAIMRLVADLRAEGMLPNLSGVEVWVGGAGLASGDDLSATAVLEIRAVWLAVFVATGATVTRYAPQLLMAAP